MIPFSGSQPDGALYVDDVFSAHTYTGTGATAVVGNGIALANGPEWFATSSYLSGTVGHYRVTTDSSGNIYTTNRDGAGTGTLLLTKYNSTGTLQWQRYLLEGNAEYGDVAVDTSGNIFLTMTMNNSGYALIAKYNSSGTIQWQRKLSTGATTGMSIALDTGGNVLVAGWSDGYIKGFVAKYNTSGTIQWQRSISVPADDVVRIASVATDASDNVYISGNYSKTGGDEALAIKFNSSGTVQWQLGAGVGGTQNAYWYSIGVDSSGNYYMCGMATQVVLDCWVTKYNSSNVAQWTKTFQASGGSQLQRMHVSSAGDVYVAGTTSSGQIITKLNTSGVIQWTKTTTNIASPDLALNSNGLCVFGSKGNSTQLIIIPTDGSLNGSFSGTTFAPFTFSEAVYSISTNTPTTTIATGTLTEAAATATEGAGTATITRVSSPAVTSQGGMVWSKGRTAGAAYNHSLQDTINGTGFDLAANTNSGRTARTTAITAFNSTGYTIGSFSGINQNTESYASWTFRKAPKFFDVVTYTGNAAVQTLSHSLGQAPGIIIVKRTDNVNNWRVYHRSLGATKYLVLELTDGENTGATVWNNTEPTSSQFTIGTNMSTNAATYVAYLFAHDTTTDGLIQCGSFTTDGIGGATVTLGWEPQFLLLKKSSAIMGNQTDNWQIIDSSRGFIAPSPVGLASKLLFPNLSDGEYDPGNVRVLHNGFQVAGYTSSNNFTYMAIRRPNKPVTNGTQVYDGIIATESGLNQTINTRNFSPDFVHFQYRDAAWGGYFFDRLRGYGIVGSGSSARLGTDSFAVEGTGAEVRGVTASDFQHYTGNNTKLIVYHTFKRAPGVFDIVCYTGNGGGSNQTIAHGLGVVPEMIICKSRSATGDWPVYHSGTGIQKQTYINYTLIPDGPSTQYWGNTQPTSSQFTVGGSANNSVTVTYVAYLFATKAGISKVGSYTGNGSSLTINCGFTTGARFVMIKRTDSTGDWYVWDSTRGIVAGNDPHLSLNATAAEVTTNDSIDPDTSGFIVNQVAATNVNVTSATYIYLAFA
jgi:hypothetical protein